MDKHAGVTLSFKYDPLASVVVSSTCDKVPSLRQYLQATIEGQLRSVFVEDLPRLVHQTSIRRSAVGRERHLRENHGSGVNSLEMGPPLPPYRRATGRRRRTAATRDRGTAPWGGRGAREARHGL